MKNVPRYTSYPTAPHFHDGINAEQYMSWLQSIEGGNSLSLYFHIPYCRQLCWFCGCHTKIVNQYSPVTHYLKLLKQEVKLLAPLVKHLKVTHVHFGGGSPTILTAEDFTNFMNLIRDEFNFSDNLEIAVEMDPRTIDESKTISYAESGVTRASVGVQDFDPTVQKAINRIQPYDTVKNVIDGLRANGIDALNIDLIYGLPFQTLETTKDLIAKTLSLNPDRISLFGYAHVPWMKKHQELVPEEALPGKEARIAMSELARKLLLEAGYTAIGLDHFARADDALTKAAKTKQLQRNFQGYTTDSADVLVGLGVSSISSLPQGYLQNMPDNIEYERALKANNLPIARGIALTPEDIQRRDIIMSLMCNFQANVSKHLYQAELDQLKSYFISGTVTYEGGILRIDPEAHNQLRLIASVFDNYLSNTKHRYSQAV